MSSQEQAVEGMSGTAYLSGETNQQGTQLPSVDEHEAATFAPLDTAPSDVNTAGDPNPESDVSESGTADVEAASETEVAAAGTDGAAVDAQTSTETTEQKREWHYVDGDRDLINYLAAVVERNDPRDQPLILNLQAELKHDQMLRARNLDCIEIASEVMDDVKHLGRIVKTKKGNDLQIPVGYGQDTASMFVEQIAQVLKLFTSDDDRIKAESHLNTLLHRAVLQDAALLNLRRIYSIHHSHMHPRVASMLQNVVADAIQMNDGSFPHVDAQMNDLSADEWNYTQLPAFTGEHNTTHRNVLAFYLGKIVPVTFFSYSLVENIQPDPAQPPQLAMILDHDLMMVVTQDAHCIGARDIGAWREPNEADIKNYDWTTSVKVANSYSAQYQATLAMSRQQASGLILPESAIEEPEKKLVLLS